ncbi:MAG TPA: FAD-dependent monooxygenase [Steroidobacteraceae bacterium]|nr:FAD-dependent monooxygenase [Steroidobacteraceae bacterium]
MEISYDAIVIGAGPAGSSAAILLARAGRSVALLEAKPFPRRKVCGECIAASNLPLLEALGLGAAVRRQAGPELRRVALWCGEESITAALPAGADGCPPWGLALGREHLDLLLLEQARAAGAAVLQPCRALAVHGDTRGVGYEVAAAVTGSMQLLLRAPVVIRAHGSWEPPPADGAAGRRKHRAADLLGFKASFRNAALADGLLPVLAFAGGYGGMVRANDGLATLACCIRRDRLAACRRAGDAAHAAAGETVETLLRRDCRGVRDALRNASRVGPWLAAGPIQPGIRLGSGRAAGFLIGNAAGEVHPIIGEGISMALQSAWLLCEELARCADAFRCDAHGELRRREIQQRYASRWRAHFARRMRLAACFAHAAMRPGIAAPLLPLLRRAPALLAVAARVSGKTRAAVTVPSAALPGFIQGSAS